MVSRPGHSIFIPKEVLTDFTTQGVTSVTNIVKIILESTFARFTYNNMQSKPISVHLHRYYVGVPIFCLSAIVNTFLRRMLNFVIKILAF